MLKWFNQILRFLQTLLKPLTAKVAAPPDVLRVVRIKELDPDKLRDGHVYIESRGGKDRWLHMRCPCGCREVISVNLMVSHRPCWSVTWHSDGTLSVFPSLDKAVGCKSHFFIQRSRVVWA